MKVTKDGIFNNVQSQTLSVTPSDFSLSANQGNISSGSYNIFFQELQWPSSTLTCQQRRYVAVGGTQIISVSGRVDSNATISSSGQIAFSLPFSVPQGTQRIGGQCSVTDMSGNTVQSNCWFNPDSLISDDPPVVVNIIPSVATQLLWFSVTIILPIN